MSHVWPQKNKRRVYQNLIITASLDRVCKKRKVLLGDDDDLRIFVKIPPEKKRKLKHDYDDKYKFIENNSNNIDSNINNSQIIKSESDETAIELRQQHECKQNTQNIEFMQFDPETLNPYFTLSDNNTIIETGHVSQIVDNNPIKSATLATTKNKIYPSNGDLLYFEAKILEWSKKADLMIGICSSNIDVNAFYQRVPIICGWDLTYGAFMTQYRSFPGNVFPPREGETVGFLLDWKTKEYNGTVRIFKNGKEIMQKPLIENLKSSKFIFGAIPPFSLCIATWPIGIGKEYFRLKMISNPKMPELHSSHRFAETCTLTLV